ncbi:MAG: lamin tail domain-containing protein [Leptospiraceae bacterium]|nr:lamin tail domain-containing protein [Leptospiraceae bacterium]
MSASRWYPGNRPNQATLTWQSWTLVLHSLPKIAGALCLSFLAGCNALEDLLDSNLLALNNSTQLDQGYIHVDDTGNIEVEFNNLEFASNPLFSEVSFITVWVYKRGGDARVRCCTGSSTECSSIEQDSCLIGIGFSNDLSFAGDRYLNLHIPELFDKYTTKYYMPVYVADKEGIPTNYQGEYNDFSSPVQAVADRELYTVYLGLYYNVFNANGSLRIVNAKTAVGDKEIYSAVAPDYLSPPIHIETRFYRQSEEDPHGSDYGIPHLASWTQVGIDRGLFNRGAIRINEIGNAINAVTANDFLEFYNPTDTNVPLEGVYLYRWTNAGCDSLPSDEKTMNLGAVTIPAKGYYTLSRSGNTLTNINAFFNSSVSLINGDDCFALAFNNDTIFNSSDSSVIDFVGLNATGNKYEGSAAAPSLLATNTAISRCPDGTDTNNNGNDFSRRANTPGAANSCGTSPGNETSILDLSAGDVTITEINNAPETAATGRYGFEGSGSGVACSGTDDEFIEIRNNTSGTVNLGGGSLQYGDSSGDFTKIYDFPANTTLTAGQLLVVVAKDSGCYTSTTLSSVKALFDTSAWNLPADSLTVAIVKDNLSLPDSQTGPGIDSGVTGGVLDYMGVSSSTNNDPTGGAPVYQGTRANKCHDTSINRIHAGTNTNNNQSDFACGSINGTPGRVAYASGTTWVQHLNAGDILITEVNYDVDTATGFEGGAAPNCTEADDEFVEIINNTAGAVDLNGATIWSVAKTGATIEGPSRTFIFPPYTLAAGARVVIVNQDAGCYTTASLAGKNFLFLGSDFNLSSTGETVVLTKNGGRIREPQITGGGALDNGLNLGPLDIVGFESSFVYEGAQSIANFANVSVIRTPTATTDTNNNLNDLGAGTANGTPGH